MEPFEREGWTRAVAQQSLDARTILALDAHRGVDTEPCGALPTEHAVSVGLIEQALGAPGLARHSVVRMARTKIRSIALAISGL
jgi:hypothetical protein